MSAVVQCWKKCTFTTAQDEKIRVVQVQRSRESSKVHPDQAYFTAVSDEPPSSAANACSASFQYVYSSAQIAESC